MILLAVLATVTVGLHLFAYVYFMLYDREALRSERYSFGRLVISKGVLVDDLSGVIDAEADASDEAGIAPTFQEPFP